MRRGGGGLIVEGSVAADVVDFRHGERVRPSARGVAGDHDVIAAAAPHERHVVQLDQARQVCVVLPLLLRLGFIRRQRASDAAVGLDGVGEPLELGGIQAGGEVGEARAASVVHVEVGELDHPELAAQVLALVKLHLDEKDVGLLRRESAQPWVEPPAAVAPLGVELDDEEGGGARVAVRGAHDVA